VSALLNFQSVPVTLRTTRFNIPHVDRIAFTCSVCISEQTVTFFLIQH